jgi:Putative sensor
MSGPGPGGPAGSPPPSVPGGVPARRAAPSSLRLYPNPLRQALSGSTWRAAGFLAAYVFVAGWLLFAVAFTATVTAAVFLITLAGIPLLVGAAGVLHGCAAAERARLRPVLAGPVRGGYRPVAGKGILAQVRARWRDPATWREAAYLIGMWPLLFALDTVVLSLWLTLLAGVTLPAWYWAPRGNVGLSFTDGAPVHGVTLGYFPHGPNGPGSWGLYVDTLPRAFLAAAGFLVAFLLVNYVLVVTARAHARIAGALLRAPADPLAPVKEVLTHPGPLGPLHAAR